jgi:Fe-S oxidoreductase
VLRRRRRRGADQPGAPLREKAFQIKQRQVEATGMDTVYTSCSGCRQTLEHGGKAAQWNKTVASLLELVADNLKD